jgi:hypothetical protein
VLTSGSPYKAVQALVRINSDTIIPMTTQFRVMTVKCNILIMLIGQLRVYEALKVLLGCHLLVIFSQNKLNWKGA